MSSVSLFKFRLACCLNKYGTVFALYNKLFIKTAGNDTGEVLSMLWKGRQGSGNIEDIRGLGGTGLALGGGGCGTLIIVIIALLFGFDPSSILNQSPAEPNPPATQNQPQRPGNQANNDEMKQFISVVLKDTEDVWREEFRKIGRQYREPKLVLFTEQVRSACGLADSGMGPFYCPGDEKVYIDFSFFRELENQFRAPGDFAQAYVLAHEVGHHVHNLLGTSDKADAAQRRARNRTQANQYSVALELQAACYGGIFARHIQNKGYLEAGDVEEALRAAAAVGDDNIQKQTQGYVVPDSFTHGLSQQRAQWFNRGFQTGDVRQCNTFAAR